MLRSDAPRATSERPPLSGPIDPHRILRHFARRFREAYGASYPLDGAGHAWPASTGWAATRTELPSAAENVAALHTLSQAAPSLAEAKARIDRLFKHPHHRAAGICLERVVAWWPTLASEPSLEVRTRALAGAL